MWAYLTFIHFKIQLNDKKKTEEENKNLENQVGELENQISELEIENQDLKQQLHKQNFHEDMEEYGENKDKIDSAVSEFITL